MNADALVGLTPTRIAWHDSEPTVEWRDLGDSRFTDPFFEQTISRHGRRGSPIRTPVDALHELELACPGVAPSGFVFHMSRCGSTLVAQMLAASAEHIVISEADPIDTVLRSRVREPATTAEQRVSWLQGLINAYGWRRAGSERRLFVKFDSWSVFDLPLIGRAYPDVPWIFMYRRPVEVLASHARERGSQMVPGVLEPELLGLDPTSIEVHALDDYAARVLGAICEAAVEHHSIGRGMLVDYADLPSAAWPEISSHFGMTIADDDLARMHAVAGFHAKRPYEPYDARRDVGRQPIAPHLRELAERWVDPWYRQLEALRG